MRSVRVKHVVVYQLDRASRDVVNQFNGIPKATKYMLERLSLLKQPSSHFNVYQGILRCVNGSRPTAYGYGWRSDTSENPTLIQQEVFVCEKNRAKNLEIRGDNPEKEVIARHAVQRLLGSKYECRKAPEGCAADMFVSHESWNNKWLPVQLKCAVPSKKDSSFNFFKLRGYHMALSFFLIPY